MLKPTLDKKETLKLCKSGADLESRLFYQARNLAIEAMCLRLENTLVRQGFLAKVIWSESSTLACLQFELANPKKGQAWEVVADMYVWLEREHIRGLTHLSSIVYGVKSLSVASPTKHNPKVVQQFCKALHELNDTGHFQTEIDKVNYPFDYKTLSVF